MPEQKPKLAVAVCEDLNSWSMRTWRSRLALTGFEPVDASYHVYNVEKRIRRVVASAGLVVLNQNILEKPGGVYKNGSVIPLSDDLIKTVDAAHERNMPVYFTADPGEANPSKHPNLNLGDFEPYTIIEDDLATILKQLQQEQPHS